MSAEMPWAASDCSMPTWIAPKLPPPANTKAVLAGLLSPDADKASSLAASWDRVALDEFIAGGEKKVLGGATRPTPIPGRGKRELWCAIAHLRIHTHDRGYGFRACAQTGASRNDDVRM